MNGIEFTVQELTPSQFGMWLEVPTRNTAGWLYGIHDEFNDGYPSRTLGIIAGDDGSLYREEEFTDSDPTGHPKTLSDVVTAHEDRPQPPTSELTPDAQTRETERKSA